MKTEPDKFICQNCWVTLTKDQVLTAPNPFSEGAIIQGCPECRCVETVVHACDEPDCWNWATCGNPTPSGYRYTCGIHQPHMTAK